MMLMMRKPLEMLFSMSLLCSQASYHPSDMFLMKCVSGVQ